MAVTSSTDSPACLSAWIRCNSASCWVVQAAPGDAVHRSRLQKPDAIVVMQRSRRKFYGPSSRTSDVEHGSHLLLIAFNSSRNGRVKGLFEISIAHPARAIREHEEVLRLVKHRQRLTCLTKGFHEFLFRFSTSADKLEAGRPKRKVRAWLHNRPADAPRAFEPPPTDAGCSPVRQIRSTAASARFSGEGADAAPPHACAFSARRRCWRARFRFPCCRFPRPQPI